jgi:DNA-binding transcriptional regulator YiaG
MNTFGSVLQRLRAGYFVKQQCLAVRVGCTEAAVSFWEGNKRLPSSQLFARLLKRIKEAGASSGELNELVNAYRAAVVERSERGLSHIF